MLTVHAFAANSEDAPTVALKYKTKSVYRNNSFTNVLKGAKGKVVWKSSNKKIATVSKKGVVTGKKLGKCTITARNAGKTYKCKVRVVRRKPNFDATIVDVHCPNNGAPYVKVRFKNKSRLSLRIYQKGKYYDYTKPTYPVRQKKKSTVIKGKTTKTITFYNYGKNEIWNFAGRKDADIFAEALESDFFYGFRFDGRKYSGNTFWSYDDSDYQWVDYYESTYGGGTPTNASER